MRYLLALSLAVACFMPAKTSASVLRFEYDAGELFLTETDGSDYGPTYTSASPITFEFLNIGSRTPEFSLRSATVDFCNNDRCLQDGGSGSSVLVTRGGEEVFYFETVFGLGSLSTPWLRGNFGTAYSDVSLTFDHSGRVTDWSWFLDHDGTAEIYRNGTAAFEQFNSIGNFVYASDVPGTWTRTLTGPSPFLAPVPLPAPMFLLAFALSGLFGLKRARRAA